MLLMTFSYKIFVVLPEFDVARIKKSIAVFVVLLHELRIKMHL